jgi:putative nucleotidyltransferase with HDIG domain
MIRILFVEDDPVVMANLRRVLSTMKREWEMRFCTNGEEAVTTLMERTFDVIVTDLSMPGMNGMELLALTQYQHPRMIRVLVSDVDNSDHVVNGAGVAHRILRKPFDPAELSAAIDRCIELEQRLNDPDLQRMISEVGVLPSPSRTVVELNDLLGQEDATVDSIAAVVGSDMNMTAKLLQVVNSAYFSLSHHITDVREAVSYLGLDTVRNLTVAMELMRSFEVGPALVQSTIDELHERSLTVAHLARELMPDRASANDAFVAALLHDVGLLVVASQLPEKFIELRVQTMRGNLPMTEVEMSVIGAHHADIGAHLLDLWGLPYEIVEAVARHHDAADLPSSGLDVVHAVHIAEAIVNGHTDDGDDTEWEPGGELDADYLDQLGVAEKVYRLASHYV